MSLKWWRFAWNPYMPGITPDRVRDESGTWWHVVGKVWWLSIPIRDESFRARRTQ